MILRQIVFSIISSWWVLNGLASRRYASIVCSPLLHSMMSSDALSFREARTSKQALTSEAHGPSRFDLKYNSILLSTCTAGESVCCCRMWRFCLHGESRFLRGPIRGGRVAQFW